VSTRTPRTRKAKMTTTKPVADSELVAFLHRIRPVVIGADQALALAEVLEHELLAANLRLRAAEEVLADTAEIGERARSFFSSQPHTQEARNA
jgi:hypothetical protein